MGNPYREPAPPKRRVWLLPDTKRDRVILFGLAAAFVGGVVFQGLRAKEDSATTRFTQAEVEAVVARNRVDLRNRCFAAEPASTTVIVHVQVAAYRGEVVSTNAESASPSLSRCVEREVRTWQFPSRPHDETVRIPIVFERS